MQHNASMPGSSQARWAALLVGVAAWASAVPWLAEAVGLGLAVPTRLEVADHVLPGVVTLMAVVLLVVLGGRPGSVGWLGAGSAVFLAGLWTTTTHVPLIFDAFEGAVSWGAAVLHFSAGPPIFVLGLWMLLRSQHSAAGVRQEG